MYDDADCMHLDAFHSGSCFGGELGCLETGGLEVDKNHRWPFPVGIHQLIVQKNTSRIAIGSENIPIEIFNHVSRRRKYLV